MKKRLVGASIVILVLASIVISPKVFGGVISILAILGLKELIDIKYKEVKILPIKILSYILLISFLLNNYIYNINVMSLVYLSIISLTIPVVIYNNKDKYSINDCLYYLGIIFLLSFSFGTIIYLRTIDIYKCLYIFIISFAADTFAYLGGSLVGKTHFTSISPKKTIEGSLIGIILGTITGTIYYFLLVGNYSIIVTIIISFMLTIISEIGDLFFSSIKRYYNKKDYSNLIPGHGGILDRFDSVIFVSLGIALIISVL